MDYWSSCKWLLSTSAAGVVILSLFNTNSQLLMNKLVFYSVCVCVSETHVVVNRYVHVRVIAYPNIRDGISVCFESLIHQMLTHTVVEHSNTASPAIQTC